VITVVLFISGSVLLVRLLHLILELIRLNLSYLLEFLEKKNYVKVGSTSQEGEVLQ
jgi:hypothetical protein